MARFDSAIALARRQIEKNGELVTLRKFAPAAADPAKPWERVAAATQVDATVRAVFLPRTGSPVQYADGTLSKVGDKWVLMSPTDVSGAPVAPEIGAHFIRTSGEVWVVAAYDKFDPNGQTIMFDIGARQ